MGYTSLNIVETEFVYDDREASLKTIEMEFTYDDRETSLTH
jgi:hypothetical protein